MLPIIMTALLFAVLMLTFAPHVLDDDTADYIIVQTKIVCVGSDPVVSQYWDNAMVILIAAVQSIAMTAPWFAVLVLNLALRALDDDTPVSITVQTKSGVLWSLIQWLCSTGTTPWCSRPQPCCPTS